MSELERKCPDCGHVPDPGVTECEACFSPIQFFCRECRQWLPRAFCPKCGERARLETLLSTARARGNLGAAVAAAEHLATGYPGRSDYHQAHVALEHAAKAVHNCHQIALPLERWKEVKRAKDLLSQAESSLRVAGMPETLIEPIVSLVDQAADELEGDEQRKRQMVAALRPAAIAAVGALLLWAFSHVVAGSVARLFGAGGAGRVVYLGINSTLCALGIAALISLVARFSWGIASYAVGLMAATMLGFVLLLVSAVGSYWLGLLVLPVAAGGLTWLLEGGMDPEQSRKDPLRALVRDRFADISGQLFPRFSVYVGIATVMLLLLAPCLAVPHTVSANVPLTVSITAAEPVPPELGKEFRVYVTGSAPGGGPLRFESCTETDGIWRDIPLPGRHAAPPRGRRVWPPHTPPTAGQGGLLAMSIREPGPLILHFRSIDSRGNTSAVTSGEWFVHEPTPGEAQAPGQGSPPIEAPPGSPPNKPPAGEQRSPSRPSVQLVGYHPRDPVAGDALTVYLGGSPPGEKLVFWYRVRSAGSAGWTQWQVAPRGTVRLQRVRPGSLRVEFYCQDALGSQSEVCNKEVYVRNPAATPLKVQIADIQPDPPLIAGDLRIRLRCDRASDLVYDYRYQYQFPPQTPWQHDEDGQLTIGECKKGKLILQFRVSDRRYGDQSEVKEHVCTVEQHRFEVTKLRQSADGFQVVVQDRQSGRESAVGKSDALAEYTVTCVNVPRKVVVARSPANDVLQIAIPPRCVQALAQQLRKATRKSASRSARPAFASPGSRSRR